MNKSDLIAAISEIGGFSHKKTTDTVNLIFTEMIAAMEKGDRIEIRGFGSFMVKEYKTYVGRNPKSKESIVVPPKKLPYFKVGKELKARVNGIDDPSGLYDDDEDDDLDTDVNEEIEKT